MYMLFLVTPYSCVLIWHPFQSASWYLAVLVFQMLTTLSPCVLNVVQSPSHNMKLKTMWKIAQRLTSLSLSTFKRALMESLSRRQSKYMGCWGQAAFSAISLTPGTQMVWRNEAPLDIADMCGIFAVMFCLQVLVLDFRNPSLDRHLLEIGIF